MMKFADLIRQFSTSVGTGPITFSGTPTGFRTFASALATGDTFYYSIVNLDKPAEVELGIGTMLVGGNFSRAAAGAPTNFSAGKKQVSLVVGAAFFTAVQNLLTTGVVSGADLAAALAVKADQDDLDTLSASLASLSAATTGALSAKVDLAALSELVDDRIAALLVAGTNITLTYNDVANTLTIDSAGGTGGGGGGGTTTYALDFSDPANSGYLALRGNGQWLL